MTATATATPRPKVVAAAAPVSPFRSHRHPPRRRFAAVSITSAGIACSMEPAVACRLPPELLLLVLDSLVPPPNTVALHLSDPSAKAIHAFTRVSRLTYPAAVRHLYSHCLSIDSENRLRLLLISLDALLSPRRSAESTLPHVDVKPLLASLYLAPFPSHSIDNQPVAHWSFELLSIMQSSLKRLVVSMPFDTMDPHQDHLNVMPKLSSAFSQLSNLEEFVSCRLFPDYWWTFWPNLKKLALHAAVLEDLNPKLDEPATLQNLEYVVLPNASFYTPSSRHVFLQRTVQHRKHTKFVVLHENDVLRAYWSSLERWMSMGLGESPADQKDGHRNECHERFCLPRDRDLRSQWLLKRALEGKLWAVEIEPEPPMAPQAWPPDYTRPPGVIAETF